MNLFMMYEEPDESAAAGAKLGQTARGWASSASVPTSYLSLLLSSPLYLPLTLLMYIDIQFEINQTLRLHCSSAATVLCCGIWRHLFKQRRRWRWRFEHPVLIGRHRQ